MGKYIKYAVAAAYISFGIMAWVRYHNWWMALTLLVCAVVFIYSIFRHGSIGQAMKSVQDSKFDKAEEYLSYTVKYEWLSSTHKAYYHIANGFILINENNKKDAAVAFENALQHKIKNKGHRAELHLQLAALLSELRQTEKARIHLQEAKTLGVNDKLAELLKKIEKQLR